MKIWIDADACPAVIREIVFKASQRMRLSVVLVANQYQRVPSSELISFVKVDKGLNKADQYISDTLQAGDLVITADIPLAAEVIDRDGHALSPRGEMFSEENIGSRLSMRNFMEELRDSGMETGGPPPMGASDKKKFAGALDRFLARHAR